MANTDARQLMESAWEVRRKALELPPAEQRAAFGRARARLLEAIGKLEDDAVSVQRAHALHLLANVEVDLGNEPGAQQLWEESVRILRDRGTPLQLAHKLRHLGDLLREQGDLGRAAPILDEALGLYREFTPADGSRPADTLDLANAVRRVALLREASEQRPEAIELWTETRELYRALDLRNGVEEADERLATLERLTGSDE